ncbi:MAG: aconitate hydratase AcnA [Planctomycetota bacterium]
MDSFKAHTTLDVAGTKHRIASLPALAKQGYDLDRLPFSLKILLENLLRREDGDVVTKADVEAVARWKPVDEARPEIAFMPARVLLQDFTGVPAVVDLAAMRDAMVELGGDPQKINPLQPVELVIDHSVQVDAFGRTDARQLNSEKEFERNKERYAFLRWGQSAFKNFKAVPPDTGIVHQVNLEYLARVTMTDEVGGSEWLYCDTLVGTDSHTTMVNGLGVLGWGVGGIEAEAAMLGQPATMLIPDVVGVKLTGKLPEGATATDLVLRVTQRLREHGVVGKFVEFFGPGVAHLPLADRATIANMAPEYGATCGLFPVDDETLAYLRFTGRREAAARTEAYFKAQGMFGSPAKDPEYTAVVELDLGTIEPSLAGPKRPQDRVPLSKMGENFAAALDAMVPDDERGTAVAVELGDETVELGHGMLAIAAITSCTNTSNPSVMVAAGLVAKKARERGLSVKPWVKTSLAPGSQVVTRYLEKSGLLPFLEELRFHVVGYGCTTCIGNSGPLPEPVADAIDEGKLVAAAVLSGNRNFEGRVHAQVRANYLASPPLVVAYALAGRVDFDPRNEPLCQDPDGNDVFLKDVWPSAKEVQEAVKASITSEMYESAYGDVYKGSEKWRSMPVPKGDTYAWDETSTYVQLPPYFQGMGKESAPLEDVRGARVLALLGDSVTTDHISPAGSIKADSPAGTYLREHGVDPEDFNSYGSRRGNHEVMMRGTFANIRIKNQLVPGVEGGFSKHLPSGEQGAIWDVAARYMAEKVPTIVLAGAEYGTGSSRDWAAKGPMLQGVKVVVAKSFERIHRSNLIGMGILPLQFPAGKDAAALGLDGTEVIDVVGIAKHFSDGFKGGGTLRVVATKDGGEKVEFDAVVRVDTPQEGRYLRHGGILQYVLRSLIAS